MTDAVLAPDSRLRAAGVIDALRQRQPALASVGLACLALFVVAAALPLFDARRLDGVSVWAKPAKFFLSTGVFLVTSAWFFGYVRADRRRSRALVWSVRVAIAAAAFELAYITLQAAQGERSHFNQSDLAHAALYGLMGAGALALLASKIPLALEIWRRPAEGLDRTLGLAVVLGLALTVALGALSGLYMGGRLATGHVVGAAGGAAPLFGWNRAGGDLRVAHFFGMHGEQILPLAAVVARALFSASAARAIVILTGAALAILTLAAFAQAMMGRPFPLG